MQRAQFVAAIIVSFSFLFLAVVSAHARPLNRHGGPGRHRHPVQLQGRDSRRQRASQITPVNPVGGNANAPAGNLALSAGGIPSSRAAGNRNLQRIRRRNRGRASGIPSQSNTTATGVPAAYGRQPNNPATGNYPLVPSVDGYKQGLRRRNQQNINKIQRQSDTTAPGTRNYQPAPAPQNAIQSSPTAAATGNSQPVDTNGNKQQAPVNANGGQPHTTDIVNKQHAPVNANGNNQQAPVNAKKGQPNTITTDTGNSQQAHVNANGGQPNSIPSDTVNNQHAPVNANGNNPQASVNANGGQPNTIPSDTVNNRHAPVNANGNNQQARVNANGGQPNTIPSDTVNNQHAPVNANGNNPQAPVNANGGQPNTIPSDTVNNQHAPVNANGNNQQAPVNANGDKPNTITGNNQQAPVNAKGGKPNTTGTGNFPPAHAKPYGDQYTTTGIGNSEPVPVRASGGQPNNNVAGTGISQPNVGNISGGQLNNTETGIGNSQPTGGSASGGEPNNKAAGTENSQPSGRNTSGGQLNSTGTGTGNSQPAGGSASGGQPNNNAANTGNSKPSGGNTSGGKSNHIATGKGKFRQASANDPTNPKDNKMGIGSLLPAFGNPFHNLTDDCNDSNNGNQSSLVHEFLKAHNEVRKMFNQPLYTWDQKLAQLANQYATQRYSDCAMTHSPWHYGENLAYGGSPKWTATQAMNEWFKERHFYDFKTNTCFGENHKCGHFTQMVWRDTLSVGCARQPCFRNGREGVIIVCEYEPAGNYEGENPFVSANENKS